MIPFAAGHELIRQRRQNLTLIGPISDILFDQLIGADCVQKITAAWVGNVSEGLGHCYRRAFEKDLPHPLIVEEHSNQTIALALFTFDPQNGEAVLHSYHPGSSIAQIQEQTGWPLRTIENCAETAPPEPEELRLIRACDPPERLD